MILFPGPDIRVDPVSATLGGLMFGTTDDFGTQITIEDSEGWYGSPGFRRDRADRPSQHGSFPTQGYSNGRTIVLSGKGLGADPASAIKSMRALRAILSDGGSDTLTWFDPDQSLTLSAVVERDDVQIKHFDDRNFTWQMVLFAPDRRVYGDAQTADTSLPGGGTGLAYQLAYPLNYGELGSPGRVQFTNTGAAPTEPSFTLSGPLTLGFEITRVETAERLRYEHAVGTSVVVDCAAGTITEGGEQRARYLTVREWFSVGPGETATFQFSTLGPESFEDPAGMSGSLSPAYP